MHYLVKYGYYGDIEDIKKLLVPLLSLLDGRNDKPYPVVKGTVLIVGILRSSGKQVIKFVSTRMHSSRMRTARLLAVSPSMHYSWGGSAPGRGCLLLGGVSHHALSQISPPRGQNDRHV